MKKRVIIAAITALSAVLAFASCGHDVPRSETVGENAPVTDVAAETTTTTDDESAETQTTTEKSTKKKSEKTEAETTAAETTNASRTGYVAGENGPIGSKSTNATNSNGHGNTSATPDVKPSGVALSYTSAEIVVGQTKKYPDVYAQIDEVWSSSDTKVATVDKYGNITAVGEGECVIRVVSATDNKIGAEVNVTVKKLEGTQVVEGVTYIQGMLIANKSYGLPASYNPGGLTAETSAAFSELVNAAASDGVSIWNVSGFRSYDYQSMLYNNYVASDGQAAADTYSARPGYSEHQTGLAIDCNDASDNFIGSAAAIWLENNCTDYGFIIRYPQGKQSITGYKYEPWHIRYVGKENAKAVKAAAVAAGDPYLTLEEYLGIDSYYH